MDMNYRGECGREGVGRMEWSGGGEWDNCNSIINKYIFKKLVNSYLFTSGILRAQPAAKSGYLKTVGFSEKA